MSKDIKQQLHFFFPGHSFPYEDIEEGLEKGEIFDKKAKILPFLQTALFDDKVLEVELDGRPRVYFSRLQDDLPVATEDEAEGDTTTADELEYSPGDYLKTMSHLVTLPLEPGLGNMHLRHSRFIVLRMFTNAYAVELGTTFTEINKVDELPVLKFAFPKIARIVRNAREFRAKVPEVMDFTVVVNVDKKHPNVATTAVNISFRGMSFSVTQEEQEMFVLDSKHSLKLYIDDELVISLDGTVKHLSKVRKKGGLEYICGVEFDLVTPTLAKVVESTVATVQRIHIKDLAEKSDASGISLIT